MAAADGNSWKPRDYPVIGLIPPEKLVAVASFAGLVAGSRVIDFGCGFGEALRSWAEHLGVSGIGIDVLPAHIEAARKTIAVLAFAESIELICGDATAYEFTPRSFDMAACINASNMFGSPDVMFRNAIRHLGPAVRRDGHLLIGEVCYNTEEVPAELIAYEGPLPTESALLQTMRQEGYELVYMLHADSADWDRYISSNCYHTARWLELNPEHPDRRQALDSHRRFQDMYVRYRRKYQESVALLMKAL